ncbi:Por secretion system C-terminal sorting domain-containing protein [Mariniphaga anaerophila]|uniref:Por secretion system C-terminal sorting domain-containing protein n=1 Tax=Mariniphaga anaerophila TaxID=1484053 RepID=A0A1M5FLP7_9BACT|nr:T9SS type A sorting domain-containing protein [Mariniphaga anaerophila]SHF92415.1 Por secretion system C-terminal sorting domain-containing protein [Mariniphaga anaerophila]
MTSISSIKYGLIIFLLTFSCAIFAQNTETDITFFVGSDIHYKGNNGSERISAQLTIDDMNTLPGVSYPATIGGNVASPVFVAFCGDETDKGIEVEIAEFQEDLGFKGEGRLNYPVYEGFGNHDSWGVDNNAFRDYVAERNLTRDHVVEISENGLHYGWEIAGIHFVQLNLYAGNAGDDDNFNNIGNKPYYSLDFLEQYLEKHIGLSGTPVIIFQHYGWDDFSMNAWGNGGWWSQSERDAYYEVIKDYNIAGIFWGHSHATKIDKWNGIDIYNDGAMQDANDAGEYMVVKISGDQMSVAVRDADGNGKWGETSVKTIKRPNPNGVTFFAASDIHYGYTHATIYNAANVDSMNALPGKSFPEVLGGKVDEPRGVIIAGDATVSDLTTELEAYTTDWGVNKEGRLNYPVYDTWGNHDGSNVRNLIKSRNKERASEVNLSENELHYSFDWDNIHFVTVGIFPGNEPSAGVFNYNPYNSLDFLKYDLENNVGKTGEPVVIYQHFGFGSHSLEPDNWWTEDEADAYYNVIKDYNIIAIIHGHEHEQFFGKWNGIDIINLPHYDDVKETGFCAINITGTELKAAMYNTKSGWMETFQKDITLGSVNWNIRPSASIALPQNMSYFDELGPVELAANAEDEDGSVVSVEFFVNGVSVGTLESKPFSISYEIKESGYFDFYIEATDDLGGMTKSDTYTFAVGKDINLAPLASELTTSHVSPWEKLEAINNRYNPNSSTDKNGSAYGNWDGAGKYDTWNWVQYDFPWEITLGSSEVYWWTDNGGIAIPYNSYLEYWNEEKGSWEECPNPIINGEEVPNSSYGLDNVTATNNSPAKGCKSNQYNVTVFGETITTTKVRLHFISYRAQGILEWKIYQGQDAPTGIEQMETGKLMVYPNPSSDMFHIYTNMNDNCELTVFDMYGKLVCQHDFDSEYILYSKELPSRGTYIIQVVNGKKKAHSKIILK